MCRDCYHVCGLMWRPAREGGQGPEGRALRHVAGEDLRPGGLERRRLGRGGRRRRPQLAAQWLAGAGWTWGRGGESRTIHGKSVENRWKIGGQRMKFSELTHGKRWKCDGTLMEREFRARGVQHGVPCTLVDPALRRGGALKSWQRRALRKRGAAEAISHLFWMKI